MSAAVASPPQLLVVEDDQEILEIIQGFLQAEGYAVTSAHSLPASLATLEDRLFQFVLTDLFREPEQLHPLQSIQPLIQKAAPIPVGVMTAWRIPEEDMDGANLAFLLHKPFDLGDLLGHLDAHLHPTISSIRQTQLVEEFFHALNAGDWQRLARLCTPEVRIVPLTMPAVEVASATPSGLFSLQAVLERRMRALPGHTIEGVQVFPRPFGVAARYIISWQSRDGLDYRTSAGMQFHFKHGRIAQIDGA